MATNLNYNLDDPTAVVQYTAGADITSGSVVVLGTVTGQKCTLGIAVTDIANGATGSVCVRGVATVAKVSAAVIVQGEVVDWDASASSFDDNVATSATGDVPGGAIAAESAGNGVTSIKIILDPALQGTLTA